MLWGIRVVVPHQGRTRAIEMLHEAHPGIVCMKTPARGCVVAWTGQADRSMRQRVPSMSDAPPTPLHTWSWPEKPWSRVHMDYAGPFEGRFAIVDIGNDHQLTEKVILSLGSA